MLVIFFLLVAVLFLGGKYLFNKYSTVTSGEIEVYEGASVKQVAVLLENYGNIKNSNVFYYYIKLKLLYHEKIEKKPFELIIKHGKYKIADGDFESVIAQLNAEPEPKKPAHVITIPESSTVESIADILAKKKIVSKKDFIAYTQNEKTYANYQQEYEWLPALNEQKLFLLEGYLQANTYNLPDNPTVEMIVDMMLKETNEWYTKNKNAIGNSGMTFDEIITLASVVEAESMYSEDRPKVAQVFLNRIQDKMKLESDMTAAYANQEHKVFMYYKDIETESPYNTYHVNGLPIGPINSPSKESFKSVLKPAGKAFKAVYFYARPSGETFYAESWAEHELNRLAWEHEWKALEKK